METIGGCRIKDLGTDEALDVCWRPGAPNDSLSRPGAGFDDGWHWFSIGGIGALPNLCRVNKKPTVRLALLNVLPEEFW